MIPEPESESESDVHHFSGIYDSDSSSNSSKNRFYCIVLESIPKWNIYHGCDSDSDSNSSKNGIVTPLSSLDILT